MSNKSVLLFTVIATSVAFHICCNITQKSLCLWWPDAEGGGPKGRLPRAVSGVEILVNPFLALRQESLTWVSVGYSHTHLFRVRDSELEKILERDDLDESVCHV